MAKYEYGRITKDLILDTAFSFLDEPRFSTFSMNELAARLSCTKPAIYRHFAGKDALLDAMENRVIEGLAPYLKTMGMGDDAAGKKSFGDLIEHFIKNSTHINYLIAQMSSEPNYEVRLREKCDALSLPFMTTAYFEEFNKDISIFSKHVFCGMSIFYFVQIQEHLKKCGKIAETPENFGDKIVNLMLKGLSGTTGGSDSLRIEPISEARKTELLKLCEIDAAAFPEENRLFRALAAVIEKYKIPGVTIERIAAELGMAKSSLYEYFAHKNEMVRSLIEKELQLLHTIVNENSAEAKNFTEYIYILLASEMEYFRNRPSVIPICGWLLMGGADIDKNERADSEGGVNPWEARLGDRVENPDLGFPYPPRVITGWIGCLPIAFLVEAKGKNLSEEQ